MCLLQGDSEYGIIREADEVFLMVDILTPCLLIVLLSHSRGLGLNSAIINDISYTCSFPAVTSHIVFKGDLCCPWKQFLGGLVCLSAWCISWLAQDQEFEVSLWSCRNRCIIYHGKVFFWAQCILLKWLPQGQAGLRPDTFIPQQPFWLQEQVWCTCTRKTLNEEDALFNHPKTKCSLFPFPISFHPLLGLFTDHVSISLSHVTLSSWSNTENQLG